MSAILTVRVEPEHRPDTHPSFALRPVALMATITAIALTVTAGRYEFFGDELYFLSAGRRLDYTYADQGVIVALAARIADLLAPGSVTALRFPAVLMGVGAVIVAALIAYEMKGTRRAQLLAAGTYATSYLLATQVALSTFSFDATFTAVITWLFIRWVRTRQDRLIVFAGLVAALDMQVKWMIPLVWACLGAGVLLFGPREILRRPALWVASGILALSLVPILYWQSQHNWPQLAMGPIIGAEQDATGYGPPGFIPQWLGLAGILGSLMLGFGFWGVWKLEALRPYRFIAAALVLMTAFVIFTHGRPYYPTGFFPAMFALGAIAFFQYDRKRWMNLAMIPIIGAQVVTFIASLTVLPLPPSWRTETHDAIDLGFRSAFFGTTNWDRMVSAVDMGYQTLTPEEKANAVIVAQGYWQAGAVEQFGGKYNLPATYSPSRGFGFFGPPPDTANTVIYVGLDTAEPTLRAQFTEVKRVVKLDDQMGIPGIDRMVAVWKLTGPKQPWSKQWDSMTTLYFDLGLWRDTRATTRPTR
ncbi:ArnT family glycosyltransferase [Nocardia huaxiensis]|uniref:Glycosyltransferase family 39 protein n=1 Tax=Nocardia huaxiensis TaxID=2755382 RepID=A0A7D6ZGD4_9NOCA|nr:glycosyltransferase family 39 protein [Nocardia huaxiensis]QLY33138.1 glycosyltransferase family 39 protein [Nocardia huaxiensis]UFS93091.1 glycosyltransferase family 39 protein [Nocardia huaxiensis]